jgi:hypothetical protein
MGKKEEFESADRLIRLAIKRAEEMGKPKLADAGRQTLSDHRAGRFQVRRIRVMTTPQNAHLN